MYVYIHTKDIHKKIGDIPMVLYIYKTIFIYIHTYTHVHTHILHNGGQCFSLYNHSIFVNCILL